MLFECAVTRSYRSLLSEQSARTVPADPIPSIAILMTMKAKWYHNVMEKILVREISKTRTEPETRKTVRYTRFMEIIISL